MNYFLCSDNPFDLPAPLHLFRAFKSELSFLFGVDYDDIFDSFFNFSLGELLTDVFKINIVSPDVDDFFVSCRIRRVNISEVYCNLEIVLFSVDDWRKIFSNECLPF